MGESDALGGALASKFSGVLLLPMLGMLALVLAILGAGVGVALWLCGSKYSRKLVTLLTVVLGMLVGLSHAAVGRIERGERSPDLLTAARLCAVFKRSLGVSPGAYRRMSANGNQTSEGG